MLKRIFSITTKKEKFALVGILLLALINAIIDLLGISMILPISTNLLGTVDDSKLLYAVIGLIGLFIFKAAFGVFYTFITNRFGLNYSRKMTIKLINTYLSMPYQYHLDNDSSTLIRKCVYDVNNYVSCILELVDFTSGSISFVAIVAYLLIIDAKTALIPLGLLLVTSLIIILILKPYIKKIAIKVQKLNSFNYKYLSESFNGIKESKINETEYNISKHYDDNRSEIVNMTLKRNVINSIPSKLLELIGVAAILLAILVVYKNHTGDAQSIVNVLSVYAYGGIRLLPIAISAISLSNSLSFYKTSVDTIYDDLNLGSSNELEDITNSDIQPIEFKDSIKLDKVSFSYTSRDDKVIFDDVSLEIKKNSAVAFVGPSGSGKTTLLDVILGLLTPSKGEVYMDKTNIKDNLRGYRMNLSYVPQEIFLLNDTIKANILYGNPTLDETKLEKAISDSGLKEFISSLKEGLDTVVGERGVRLSGGQRQRIGIARALYKASNVIVLDEATSSLDYDTEKEILDNIIKNNKDRTLIIVTHRIEAIKDIKTIYEVNHSSISKKK